MKILIRISILLLISNLSIVNNSDVVDKDKFYTDFLNIKTSTNNYQFYAGYVDVGDDKEIYYWYQTQDEATKTMFKNKTILWMNGGPGCSSLGGAVGEVGPFRMDSYQKKGSHTAKENPYSWNKFANMLYIEFPFGVGFSSAPTEVENDYITAQYNYKALIEIYKKYPALQDTELYLIGESYAGVYVPSLSYEIHNQNIRISKLTDRTADDFFINFRGFAAGNPCTDDTFECTLNNLSNWPEMSMLFEMGVVSQEDFDTWQNLCLIDGDIRTQKYSYECHEQEVKIYKNIGFPDMVADTMEDIYSNGPFINLYDTFRVCQPPSVLSKDAPTDNSEQVDYEQSFGQAQFLKKLHKGRAEKFKEAIKNLTKSNTTNNLEAKPTYPHSYIPWAACVESTGAIHLLNDDNARIELKVKPTSEELKWSDCSDNINFRQTNGSYWIYKELTKAKDYKGQKYKIMVYSGNTDLCVPITGTRKWIDKLRNENKLKMITPMQQWTWNFGEKTQIGGFYENSDNLLFVEFQGVGHMVPQWAPEASFCAFASYIAMDDLSKLQHLNCPHSPLPLTTMQEE